MRTIWVFVATATLLASTASNAPAQQRKGCKCVDVVIVVDGRCTDFDFTYDPKSHLYGSLHAPSCDRQSNPIPGIGIVVKKNVPPHSGKSILVSETVTGDDGSLEGDTYAFDYPFVDGGAWTSYATKDGVTVGIAATGTYTISK
ncbi:MAG: hypothetical protein WDM89_22320 [Rhizomicrobium sp.]